MNALSLTLRQQRWLPPRRGALLVLIVAGLGLAACGGGGGGNGGPATVLNVLLINGNPDAPATIMVGSETETVEPCKSGQFVFGDVPEPWQITVNDEVAVDSAELNPNQIGATTTAVHLDVKADGSVVVAEPVRPGRPFIAPAQSGICP